ncbi:MAG: hypothetical protein J1F28_10060 [Oscillospiraceae bacterium]|nr:hypothetical protein [Oscillospiraceae bacterium]
MTKKQIAACNAIIHSASAAAAAAGAGLSKLPSDSMAIKPVQTAMTVALAKVFDRNLVEGAAKGMVVSATATQVGRRVVKAAVGFIPVVGPAVNATTAAAVTEGFGWTVAKQFEKDSRNSLK